MQRAVAILIFFLLLDRLSAQSPPATTAEPAAAPSATTAFLQPNAENLKTEDNAPDLKDPHSWMWLYQLPDFTEKNYHMAVEALLTDYERRLGHKLEPGPKRHAGIKVMTNTPGLTTPPALVRAVITALEARGFKPEQLFIVDQSETRMHTAGFLPLDTPSGEGLFDGVQVIALERGRYYNLKWNYDSNLPPADLRQQVADQKKFEWAVSPTPRQSLLPVPLLLDVDFWINLPVGMDEGDFGMAGALVNATLLAASNTQRFFDNPGSGAKAVADMAAVPELAHSWVLTLLSLERFQFIGGPQFNSLYTDSKPLLFMSPNPVMIDKLLYDDVNEARETRHLPPIDLPAYIDYARLPDLHLGGDDPTKMYLVQLP